MANQTPLNEFEALMAGGQADFEAIVGGQSFTWDGHSMTGILDEVVEDGYSVTVGGKEMPVTAHLLCQLPQFASFAVPQRGTRIKGAGRTFVIGSVSRDSVSVSFTLADPDAK